MAPSTSNASFIKSNACDNKAVCALSILILLNIIMVLNFFFQLLFKEPIASTSDTFFIGPIDSVEQVCSPEKIAITPKSNVTPSVTPKRNRTKNKK